MDTNIASDTKSSEVRGLYDKLEDRCLMRDQRGASDVYYDLVRAGRPLTEIIAEWGRAEPRIRAFGQARNTGISAATNRALGEARGETCLFFDHDDVLDPHAVEVMLRRQ